MGDLTLTAEQKEFQTMLRRFFGEHCSSEYLRGRLEHGSESDPAFWDKLSELGLFEFFSEGLEEGANGFRELALVAFESGRALCPESITGSLLGGPLLCQQLLTEKERKKINKTIGLDLSELSEGKKRVRMVPRSCTNVGFDDSNSAASGTVKFLHGSKASDIVLLEAANGEFYFVAAGGEYFSYGEGHVGVDLTRKLAVAEVKSAPCASVGSSVSEYLNNLNLVLKASEIAGICDKAVEMTVTHVKDRKQFEVPVGGFQAVQHGLADMYLAAEALSALVDFAAWAAESSKEQLPLATLSALGFAFEKGAWVCERAIQLHGGMGFTWEYDLHLYLRRIHAIQARYKGVLSNDEHIRELAVGE